MSTYLPTTPAAPRTADIHLTDITYTADKTPTLTIPQLTLTPGITAIIGPKGAGKTAFLHLLTTLTPAASGTLTMGGTTVPTTHSPGGASAHDLATLRAHIGYVPTYFDVDPNTPIHALATYAAWLRGYDGDHAHTAARTAIDNINLTSNAHKRLPARHVRKRNNGHRVTDHHPVLRAHVALALATAGAPPSCSWTTRQAASQANPTARTITRSCAAPTAEPSCSPAQNSTTPPTPTGSSSSTTDTLWTTNPPTSSPGRLRSHKPRPHPNGKQHHGEGCCRKGWGLSWNVPPRWSRRLTVRTIRVTRHHHEGYNERKNPGECSGQPCTTDQRGRSANKHGVFPLCWYVDVPVPAQPP